MLICKFEGCDKQLVKSSIKAHILIHTGEKPYKCTYEGCGYASNQRGNLVVHLRVHTGERPYSCDQCEYRSTQIVSMDKHKLTHSGEKPFKCDFEGCDYASAQKQALDSHKRTHSGEKPFKCDFEGCDYASAQKQALDTHNRSHTGETPYKCDFEGCTREFRDNTGLNYHKRTHTGERPYKCDVKGCDKSFTDSSPLADHKRIHTGEKPYKCEFEKCDYSGRTLSALKSHVRHNHTGEKPYKCEYEECTESFTQLSMMRYHLLRIHIKEKPFACEFDGCGLRFITKGQLEIHNRMHTGERPFKCTECEYSYISKGGLTSHTKAYHTVEGQQARKKEEERIAKLLTKAGIEYKREHKIRFDCAGGTFCRIDFVIISKGNVIFLEVDEDQHKGYDVSCDTRRMASVHECCLLEGNALPILFIRYNPNEFMIKQGVIKITRKQREVKLLSYIKSLMQPNITLAPLSIQYMYYDRDEDNKLLIWSDPTYSDTMKELVLPFCE